jgi:NAD(P)H-hydrate epimerase
MSVPVINIAMMREWEAATWAAGQTEAEVIRRVGHRIADRARQLTGEGDSILLLAGKGHNGDDVRAAQGWLAGRQVTLIEVFHPEAAPPVLEALRAKPALIVDGLFGIGLNRPLDEAWQQLIAAINAANRPVLAVDVPSGLNADTGEPMGAAIQASLTLTVGAPKIGMLAAAAWPYLGRLEVMGDVGLLPCPLAGELLWSQPEDFQDFPPQRTVAGHKGTFGHLALVVGSLGYAGAAVLATRGAQRAQPGLATVFTQPNVYPVVASQLQSAMVAPWQPEIKFPDSLSALLVGPGLAAPEVADNLRRWVQLWWRDAKFPVIVDASALDLLAAGPLGKQLQRVITPHLGEAARLLKWAIQRVQADRVTALRELSKRYGNCWVVLKGYQTLTGRSEGGIFVNSSGNPHLAQGGSGDLLSGFIAGLLAQPALQADLAQTLRYAVWQHGAAADRLQAARANWMVEDLALEIGNVRPLKGNV